MKEKIENVLEHSKEILFLDMESWKINFNYWTDKSVEAAPVLLWYKYIPEAHSGFWAHPQRGALLRMGFTILEKRLQLNVYIYI